MTLAPDKIDATYSVVEALRPIANHLNGTVAQVAIAWILRQPGVTATLTGTQSPSRARENAGGASLDLTLVIDSIERVIGRGPAFT